MFPEKENDVTLGKGDGTKLIKKYENDIWRYICIRFRVFFLENLGIWKTQKITLPRMNRLFPDMSSTTRICVINYLK